MSGDKKRTLPRSVAFPNGIRITVRLVSDERIREAANELVDGLWLPNSHSIFIRKKLPDEDRIAVFYHELHHCVADLEWDFRKPESTKQEKSDGAGPSDVPSVRVQEDGRSEPAHA